MWRLMWLCLCHYLHSCGIVLAGAAGNEIIGTRAEKLESDEPCALMELHQQQPGNSTHLLYKHKRGQRAYLIPVGSLYREQSQAAAIWEEEAVVDTACTHCHHIYLGPGKTLPFPWIWTGFFFNQHGCAHVNNPYSSTSHMHVWVSLWTPIFISLHYFDILK